MPKTLQGFVFATALAGATVYTDDAAAYKGMPFDHDSVRHSVGEYVSGMAHTNGIESFWSDAETRAQGRHTTRSAPKHLQRYVNEFSGRHGIRDRDTIDQMGTVARSMAGEAVALPSAGRRQRQGQRSAILTPVRQRKTAGIRNRRLTL